VRFLIDECLHISLTRTANDAGFEAYHVVHRGWAGVSDHRLLDYALREELTFVTNNGKDFNKLMTEAGAGANRGLCSSTLRATGTHFAAGLNIADSSRR
jgi:predicted nuclease of predicted toxin-antitoxin system